MNEKDSPCASVVVTADLVQCLAKARDAADAQLNAVYKTVRGKLDAAEVQQLLTAQRLWIQYRDANCSAERDLYGGGTATGPAYLACLEAMTRARAKELKVTYAVTLK
ncbi:MAG TPA: lysozyme inhibitor LprI family protein [Bryobacteraceae bacterium]|nr:lysozyme inhibitor LprI family protein [Bryobacteraceae bacterium]